MARKTNRRPAKKKATPSRNKVAAYRARMRENGMRLVQFWVPDTRTPAFKKEARRQMRLLAESPYATDDQAFVDAISEFNYE